ncbi:transcription termination factor MTERF2, chloroplastic isoform X2 [Malania oleifera]|uniref:transcription termination factor MTERF2, chloroplastic isoform X2 n=1 Tax=Malania oleifera TaxID=397392 RepID=UPI0025AE717E|nr:transcription termination factor MTERF2, chloroplastic isoform X2 [Malania oleifera]
MGKRKKKQKPHRFKFSAQPPYPEGCLKKMQTCPQNHHSPQVLSHTTSFPLRHRCSSPSATALHLSAAASCRFPNYIIASSSVHHQTQQKSDTTVSTATPLNSQDILRKHNAKSTALLMRHFSPQTPELYSKEQEREQEGSVPEEEKVRMLEISLVTKRIPQFPGSIYDVGSSSPPLHSLFRGGDGSDDDEKLIRAIDIRRKVTADIFKEAMQSGKFGITYSSNLASWSPDFIDYIMIEAALMKKLPEFSQSPFNFRAKTVIQNSNVVPLIRWLKHHSLSYPQIGKLLCLSRRNLDAMRCRVEWLKSIHVRGRCIGVALVRGGENILGRSMEELDEIVGYLESKGVRRDWMGVVISRCPQLLLCSMEEVKTRAGFYLDLGMKEKDFGTMVYDYPKALGYFTLEEMNQKVNYLREFGLCNEDIGRLLAFQPRLIKCSIEEKWKPLVKYLYYLGIDRDGMRRILTVKPMIFCLDLERVIVPKVRFLQDIGIREDAIGNMLVKFPHLLTYSIRKKIRRVVIFLLTEAGVSQTNIGKVIALGPELLGCSIVRKLEVNVKYFLSLGIRLRHLGTMIADFPMLLRYNIELLRPKYSYLRRTMVRPLEDLIEFPSYSLEDRIIPRHQLLVENQLNFELRYMLACSNEEFNKRVEAAVERRESFEFVATEEALWESQTTDGSSPLEQNTTADYLDDEIPKRPIAQD